MAKSRQAGFSRLIFDGISRHGGILPFLRSLLSILFSEGLIGLFHRKTQHSKILAQGVPIENIQNQSSLACFKHPQAPLVTLKNGMTLIGHPYAVLGRAEDIRTSAHACAQADIPFSLLNLYGDYGQQDQLKHKDFPFYDLIQSDARHKVNLFYLNANEMEAAAERLERQVFEGPYNIACFAWELSEFPDAWIPAFEHLHEIWAPTDFIQQAIAKKTHLPVIQMPFAIEPGSPPDLDRLALSLPENKFLFLFLFDFRSFIQRKNPWAVIEAFAKAFPSEANKPVHLVIKVNGINEKPDDYQIFLNYLLEQNISVQIIDQVMDDREIKALINQCDSFVSLHRTEGFGRGLAEAMYYQKPVIATNYSGNLDFMNSTNSCLVNYSLIPLNDDDYPFGSGQEWADADVDQAAWFMQKLVDDPQFSRQTGINAAEFIHRFHSYGAVGEKYRKRLQALQVL